MRDCDEPVLELRDPLETLPRIRPTSRYSRNHFHPLVDELVAANDNFDPPRPTWTQASVSSRSNGQFVTYHKRHPTSTAFSRKTRRLVSEDSPWERLYRIQYELDPDVGDYEMQGLNVSFITEDGASHVYTPDAILAIGNGLFAREIKATGSHLMTPDNRALFVNIEDILARARISFAPATATSLLKSRRLLTNLSYGQIHKSDVVPIEVRNAVRQLIIQGATTYLDLRPALGECPLRRKAWAFSLLASRELWFDLSLELRDTSPIRLPLPTCAPDIRSIDRSFVR